MEAGRQKAVVDAALTLFGANGYKKTSINDIAKTAGVSKALIFHYFGSKKTLYLYLARLCAVTIKNAVTAGFDSGSTDFFDRIKLAARIKINVMKKHPAVLSFLAGMHRETNAEVSPEISKIEKREGDFGMGIIFGELDISKFKEGVDPQLVMKMLSWLSEGYINKFAVRTGADIDKMMLEFEGCIGLLKRNLYGEESL